MRPQVIADTILAALFVRFVEKGTIVAGLSTFKKGNTMVASRILGGGRELIDVAK